MADEKTKAQVRRERRAERQRQEHRKQLQIRIMMLAVVVLAGVAVVLTIISNAPKVSAERLELDPVLGPADAPITIVEYGSYGCRSCRQVHNDGIIEELIEEYPGQVRFIFRDFPVIMPAFDQRSGQIAQCVLDQGNELFWDYHHRLYTEIVQGQATDNEMIALSAAAGADEEAVRECYESGTHVETVAYDLNRGRDLGLGGAPSFFINDKPLFNFSLAGFREAIDAELSG